ncbi:hypothetical protein [Ancylobacter oerskovii]|uniref:Uncharacterized protein n=1 Tax=Ancylobacter oerskovii TaxID=459519 RepID=A0ABW4YRC3_9HYPH|nr:hypothetical protein [Ancylobacter oerskovii]MBS7545668.1 hypothetical protein [Ancylobacter oerskovii]
MSASSRCPHNDVDFNLNLASFGDTNLRYLEMTGRCKLCGAGIRFRGPVGMGPDCAGIALDGSEVRIPLLFGDEELEGRPIGYSVSVGGAA